jgi:hypothetical protein
VAGGSPADLVLGDDLWLYTHGMECEMTPTNKLRFVKRDCYSRNGEHFVEPFKITILQQWWEDRNIRLAVQSFDKYGTPIPRYQGEWRDVPLETEE